MMPSTSDIERIIDESQLPFPLDVEFRSKLALEGPTDAFLKQLHEAIKLEIQRDTTAMLAQEMADEAQRCETEADEASERLVAIFSDPQSSEGTPLAEQLPQQPPTARSA